MLYRCILDAKGDLLEFWLAHPALAESPGRGLNRTQSRDLERLNLHEHGRSVMELLLAMIGRYRTNPVEVPAEALRVLLWPGAKVPQDWKQIVERTLRALMALTCAWKKGGLKGEAVFVNSWQYFPRGSGGHGDGIYIVGVTQSFLGTLAVFEVGTTKLRGGVSAATYNVSKNSFKEGEEVALLRGV